MICNALQTSPQYLLQDSLEFDGCELQLRLMDKVMELPAKPAFLKIFKKKRAMASMPPHILIH